MPKPGSKRSDYLFARTEHSQTTPVVLRFGMIYGRGILMVEAARWLARRRLLCVWKEPTLLQLLSTADFLRASEAAIAKPGIQGIYHVGDEQPVTVQQFLDEACRVWGHPAPTRGRTRLSARQPRCAKWSRRSRGTPSPLTRDFIQPRPRAALGRYAARTRGADSAAVLSNVGFRTLDALIHERSEDQKIRNTERPSRRASQVISTQRRRRRQVLVILCPDIRAP